MKVREGCDPLELSGGFSTVWALLKGELSLKATEGSGAVGTIHGGKECLQGAFASRRDVREKLTDR